jgi:hypothetical protein
MVKIVTLSLAIGIVLYVYFYLPRIIRPGRSARIRYIIFSIIAFLSTAILLKRFM